MSKPAKIEYQKLIGMSQDLENIKFTEKDAILYALGIGFNLNPLKEEDFKYTNEFQGDFTVFPTLSSVFAQSKSFYPLMNNPHIPQFAIHQILHGEEKFYFVHRKLIVGASYRINLQFIDAIDKGKNAFLVMRQKGFVKNEQGKEEVAFYIDRTIFIRGLGGFGFKGNGASPNIPQFPKRKSDLVIEDKTFPNQAFFYRLSGDPNPLHIDPNVASMAGFQRPIIHGLASYGIVAKNLVQSFLNNEPSRIKSYQTRFIGHVFPGETFSIEAWKEGDKIFFLASVVERKTKAISGVMTIRQAGKL